MLGSVYFGQVPMGDSGISPEAISGIVTLEILADKPIPPWEPVPQGTQLVLVSRFSNETGEMVEPSIVTCKIISPNETVSTLPVMRVGLGIWHATLTTMIPGKWEYRFVGNGAVIGAEEGVFWIANSKF